MRDEFGSLYDTLNEILYRHDPIKINFGCNTDEYDPEVRTILPRLKDCFSVLDLRKMIHQEFTNWFNPIDAGLEEDYSLIAEETWEAWREYQRRN